VADSKHSVGTILSQVIREGVKSALAQKHLSEKEKQDQMSPPSGDDDNSGDGLDDLFGGGDDGDQEGDEDSGPAPSKTMDAAAEESGDKELQTKDVIDRLNAIRSGKSFKDKDVAMAMDEYYNSLSDAEQKALYAFLKGISQILTGEIPGKKADEPGDAPTDVKMQVGSGPEKKKTIEPNVIRAPKSQHAGEKSVEDTSGPVPITPKRR
jgi:hypothetical protein